MTPTLAATPHASSQAHDRRRAAHAWVLLALTLTLLAAGSRDGDPPGVHAPAAVAGPHAG